MKNKLFKSGFKLLCAMAITSATLPSCSIFTVSQKPPVYVIDFVCGMKVKKTEAFEWKHKGTKYYFDTYNCKESFKMNPDKFIVNNCIDVNDAE